MTYKLLSLQQTIAELGQIQIMLGKINDEPGINSALESVKVATAKLVEVEKGVSDYMEERR